MSCILQAVKCQADSNVKNTAANPRPMYAIFSNIYAIAIFEGYKAVAVNTEQMTIKLPYNYHSINIIYTMIRLSSIRKAG